MNENIFTIGVALFVGLVIISLGSMVISSPVSAKETTQMLWFLFVWLMLSFYTVWLGVLLPKPKGDNIF